MKYDYLVVGAGLYGAALGKACDTAGGSVAVDRDQLNARVTVA